MIPKMNAFTCTLPWFYRTAEFRIGTLYREDGCGHNPDSCRQLRFGGNTVVSFFERFAERRRLRAPPQGNRTKSRPTSFTTKAQRHERGKHENASSCAWLIV